MPSVRTTLSEPAVVLQRHWGNKGSGNHKNVMEFIILPLKPLKPLLCHWQFPQSRIFIYNLPNQIVNAVSLNVKSKEGGNRDGCVVKTSGSICIPTTESRMHNASPAPE